MSVEELAQDAAARVAAGARAIRLHPRDLGGRETLEAVLVDEVVTKVRAACGMPVGVTACYSVWGRVVPDIPDFCRELVAAIAEH